MSCLKGENEKRTHSTALHGYSDCPFCGISFVVMAVDTYLFHCAYAYRIIIYRVFGVPE